MLRLELASQSHVSPLSTELTPTLASRSGRVLWAGCLEMLRVFEDDRGGGYDVLSALLGLSSSNAQQGGQNASQFEPAAGFMLAKVIFPFPVRPVSECDLSVSAEGSRGRSAARPQAQPFGQWTDRGN